MLRRDTVPFAWRLLVHRRRRAYVAAAGIGFAILVIFVQLGFYTSVVNTATAMTSRFNADIVLISPRFVHLSETSTIPRVRLFQIFAVDGVADSTPLYFRYTNWRDPVSDQRCRLFGMGFPLDGMAPLEVADVDAQRVVLAASNTVLLDRLTQSKCGPFDPDGNVEIRDQAALVVGAYELGVGFLADGSLVMSDQSFARFFNHELESPHLGLVKTVPGADPLEVARRISEILPADTRAVTRDELSGLQVSHWVRSTAVGNIFGMGVVTGFFVGLVVLYQILSADIRTQLPLYATLKAMGYGEARLRWYVLEEAWMFAALGFAPALLITAVAFPLIFRATYLPLFVTPGLMALVFALAVVMCTGAGLLSVRRLRTADPAELF